MIRIGDYIYGSTGSHNGSLLSAFNWETGQFAWKQPGYYMAQCLYKDDTHFFLDLEGKLSFAKISPEKITLLNTMQLTENPSWTLPTLFRQDCLLEVEKNLCVIIGKGPIKKKGTKRVRLITRHTEC